MGVIIARPGAGGGLAYAEIGLPPDGTYNDGPVNLDPSMTVAEALDTINEYLGATISGIDKWKDGRQVIPSGADSQLISFSPPYTDENYNISVTIVNDVDSPPSIYSYLVTNVTPSGFNVLFSGDMDSNNYVIHWSTFK
jgi:hypothetical protein